MSPEACLATKRKRAWVQEASKMGSKSKPIKKMKIELSLQPELNPAHQKTSKLRFKTGLSGMLLEMNQKLCPRTLQRSKRARRWSQKGPVTAMEEPRQHECPSPRLGIYIYRLYALASENALLDNSGSGTRFGKPWTKKCCSCNSLFRLVPKRAVITILQLTNTTSRHRG